MVYYIYLHENNHKIEHSCIGKYTSHMDPLGIYTWNPNDPCFDWKRPCFGGLTFNNRGNACSYSNVFCIIFSHIMCVYSTYVQYT